MDMLGVKRHTQRGEDSSEHGRKTASERFFLNRLLSEKFSLCFLFPED